MKTLTTTIVLSLALIGGAAQAGPPAQAAPPTLLGDSNLNPFRGVYGQSDYPKYTRAEVLAQLREAKEAGMATVSESDNAPFQATTEKMLTREQVLAELHEANGGSGATAFGEPDDTPFQGTYPSTPNSR